jgi:hypothetical protein
LDLGIGEQSIFRTDRGDDEVSDGDDPESGEWKNNETIQGCSDKYGDDDVRIVIKEDGRVETIGKTV